MRWLPLRLHRLVFALLPLLALVANPAHAVLEINISGGQESGVPIAVVPFAGTTNAGVAKIIAADLGRSGQFAPLKTAQMPGQPSMPDQVQFDQWRAGSAQYLVIGSAARQGANLKVTFYLLNVANGQQMTGRVITASASANRTIAHRIADIVFKQITGIRGAFDTRIAYVTEIDSGKKRRYTLEVADSDGANPQVVLNSDYPIMSPTWSPDGSQLAYVSFEGNRSAIWVQDLSTGKRYRLTRFKGINGAPSWSPRGDKIAVTLSKGGNPDIYVINLDTRAITQVTRNGAIDTEPAWFPDDQTLIFTSDRSGQPQIFEKKIGSDTARRLTFDTSYAAGGAVSPDGKTIAYIAGGQSGFRIAAQNVASGNMRYISDGGSEERPSFSPNGVMLIYATHALGRSVLRISPAQGQGTQTLSYARGKVRDPAWGPFRSE